VTGCPDSSPARHVDPAFVIQEKRQEKGMQIPGHGILLNQDILGPFSDRFTGDVTIMNREKQSESEYYSLRISEGTVYPKSQRIRG
jgi:hypothetical protein